MKKIVLSTLTLMLVLFFNGCSKEVSAPKQTAQKVQTREDIRIFSADNSDGKITVQSIEKAFKANGFTIVGNNNMNRAFEQRFGGGKDFHMYRLMFIHNPKVSANLIKDYPEFGLLSPLSTSVYSKDGKTISISSLSLTGMSRITGVPESNPDLISLFDKMTKSLKEALPNGDFQKLSYKKIRPDGEIITRFAFVLPNDGDDIEEAKESYQETMEGEIESQGFIVAGFYPVNEDLNENGIEDFEFYDTYAICKLEVIYPVHKLHPEVGAFAPCTMYMYKKKGEKFTRMGYPSVYNWIMSTNIFDDPSLEPLIDAQDLLESTVDSTIE
ncbi:MAG: DUF302 domain-containing protein [Campylobacterota bacterium]|nr:DUF302 domain-containing protein [Campylobacterota bacterium]